MMSPGMTKDLSATRMTASFSAIDIIDRTRIIDITVYVDWSEKVSQAGSTTSRN